MQGSLKTRVLLGARIISQRELASNLCCLPEKLRKNTKRTLFFKEITVKRF